MFPDARIICFEPVASTFLILNGLVRRLRNVDCHRTAFGSTIGEGLISLASDSTGCSLIGASESERTEHVPVTTVDTFVEESGIKHIDLLKVDTEGYDLEVLRGTRLLLEEGRVKFVFVEVGFRRGERRLVPLADVLSYLEPMGYEIFGIYDQHLEWSGRMRLRFANACFCKKGLMMK
jgi:FkbM family methyltransferase